MVSPACDSLAEPDILWLCPIIAEFADESCYRAGQMQGPSFRHVCWPACVEQRSQAVFPRVGFGFSRRWALQRGLE
ncbi:MAG: hypothetical protein CBE00_06135 [Planctomycetaceae bacterium TMED240]|nr:hypothetical protein [Rhodopirellula sp.]OUX06935.1 MAG: hypothetical protein CBE00_06135 [Planctomycetaceae bacterium TMED240]